MISRLILTVLVFGLGSAAAQESAPKTVRPFDGESLEGWKTQEASGRGNKWQVGEPSLDPNDPKKLVCEGEKGALVNVVDQHGESRDLYSEEEFGDCKIVLELLVAEGSNSGIYLMGEYEIQVLDSHGREKMRMSDMGAIYGAKPPKVNACKKPGEWQTYEITFRAPRFDEDGNKVANARFIEVKLNGKVIQEDIEMKAPTPGGLTGEEKSQGPLMFQGNHGPVAYRNIRVTPLAER